MIYAINKRTKEHRHVFSRDAYCTRDDSGDWRYVEADADGWIPWEGGECPLPSHARVDFRFRDNVEVSVYPAHVGDWAHCRNRIYHIIAYRPILDDKPKAPEWDGEGLPPVGTECEVECGFNDYEPCKILAHYNGKAVFVLYFSGAFHSAVYGFRPIRSAEDKAVEEMAGIIGRTAADGARCVAKAIYRAGYRRTES